MPSRPTEPIDLCSDSDSSSASYLQTHLSVRTMLGMSKKHAAKSRLGDSNPTSKTSGGPQTRRYGDTVKKRRPSSSVQTTDKRNTSPIDVTGDTTEDEVIVVPLARRKSSSTTGSNQHHHPERKFSAVAGPGPSTMQALQSAMVPSTNERLEEPSDQKPSLERIANPEKVSLSEKKVSVDPEDAPGSWGNPENLMDRLARKNALREGNEPAPDLASTLEGNETVPDLASTLESPVPPALAPAHGLGSWENPQPIQIGIKRRPSPTSSVREGSTTHPRNPKNPRIEAGTSSGRTGVTRSEPPSTGKSDSQVSSERAPSLVPKETETKSGPSLDRTNMSATSSASSRRPSSAASTEDPLLLRSGGDDDGENDDAMARTTAVLPRHDRREVEAAHKAQEEEEEDIEVAKLFRLVMQDADGEMDVDPVISTSDAALRKVPPGASIETQLNHAIEDVRYGVKDVTISSTKASHADDGLSATETHADKILDLTPLPEYKPFVIGGAIDFLRKRRETRAASSQPPPAPIIVDTPTPSPDSTQRPIRTASPGIAAVPMTREEWRRVVELNGEVDDIDVIAQSDHGSASSRPSSAIETIDYSVSTATRTGALTHPPDDRRGKARRQFDAELVDSWNARSEKLQKNPNIHRLIFQGFIMESLLRDGEYEDELRVVNNIDGRPPDFEFQYSNRMLYHPDAPDPELGLGCGCEGPCDPDSRTCSCVKRQHLYFYDTGCTGFAYNRNGTIKNTSVSVWECGPNCNCPPDCMNRVIQRGRDRRTKIELFKTRLKGWGIRAAATIKAGTFIGVYSGELITDAESERRGRLYTEIGRTYLFDCDGWQIANPPEGLERIDARLAQIASEAARRAKQHAVQDGSDNYKYSAFSIDAFHYGNYTRYFNHSCMPNLAITQAYVYDFHPERPLLVIVARKDIEPGEEMCISYKGIQSDDEDERVPAVRINKSKRSKGRWSKTSASVHIAADRKTQVKAGRDQCFCGAPNCDGKMFGLSDSEED